MAADSPQRVAARDRDRDAVQRVRVAALLQSHLHVPSQGDAAALNTAAKIRTPDAAARWREQQEPVAFTNGVFDLLHSGHVTLLEAARAEGGAGGVLIVGVNSDASVRRLGKGADRPVVPQQERARLVAALEAVDCVVLFEDDTPLALIRKLRPDVLVKGADYERKDIVGADDVEGWGGRVVRVPLVQDKSTTNLIAKLRNR